MKTGEESKAPKMFSCLNDSILEVHSSEVNSFFNRSLKNNSITHQYLGHSYPVQRLMWLSSDILLSQAHYEVLIWTHEPSKELKEVGKPSRILDLETTSHDIRCIEAKTVMQGAHIVLVGWKDKVQVFMVKTGGKDKAKVKKPTCEIKIGKTKVLKEIVGCEVLSDT